MSQKVQNLDHVGVLVSDIGISIDFYRDILGLELKSHSSMPDRGVDMALLTAGSGTIELLQYSGQAVPEKDGPVAHLAFAVTDIDDMWNILQTNGITLVDQTPRVLASGMKIGFLRGPDGESIELVQRPEP